jgi:DNA repair exonuclease SbcCD ATPase subunit
MLNRQPIDAKSEFIENLTHDSYVIQAGRITDVRYTTNLDRLLSIFEQKYFVVKGSEVRKEYPYQPEDENMRLITDLLYEMGANPETREEIEKEEEALRIIANIYKDKDKKLKERDKELREKSKKLKEKNKELKEKDKKLNEKDVKLKEKDKTIEENKKTIEEKDKIIAELERLLRNRQVE